MIPGVIGIIGLFERKTRLKIVQSLRACQRLDCMHQGFLLFSQCVLTGVATFATTKVVTRSASCALLALEKSKCYGEKQELAGLNDMTTKGVFFAQWVGWQHTRQMIGVVLLAPLVQDN